MRYLLDTCTFLWITAGSRELSERAREVFPDPKNEVFLSLVSVWEIVLKHQAGKLPLPARPEEFIPIARDRQSIRPLNLEERAIFALSRLPSLHTDPFDRMLVCQAQTQAMVILTPDAQIRRYPVATEW